MPLIHLPEILLFSIVGFCTQMIDGCLGMAYRVSSNTFLLSLGVSPAAASASIQTADAFATAVLGLSHIRFSNIDKNLSNKLAIPGKQGGVIGSLILVRLPQRSLKPICS